MAFSKTLASFSRAASKQRVELGVGLGIVGIDWLDITDGFSETG